jgi:hypothetical protein
MTVDLFTSGLRLRPGPADLVEGGEVLGVGVGGGVEVFLGGLDVGVAEAVHDGGEVGAAGEQLLSVTVAEYL